MKQWFITFIAGCCASFAPLAGAADTPYGVLDIGLGASYARLEQQLDFRDINDALAKGGGKPDLGKRGYGCSQREDELADVGCVSHLERLEGVETREIRLHFLEGKLQQFSVTAEVQHYDAVIAYLTGRFGAPRAVPVKNPGDQPSVTWESDAGQIVALRGKDLVFVNFQLTNYTDAIKRKREGKRLQCV